MGFKFDLSTMRRARTEEEILDGLRAYAKLVGYRQFTIAEFERWKDKPFRAAAVTYRFLSWVKALDLIGVSESRKWRYSAEEMVANLERVWKKIGRPPGNRQLYKNGKIGYMSYVRHWGSLARACEMVAAYHAGKIKKEELLKPLTVDERLAFPGRRMLRSVTRWRILERDLHRCVSCGRSPATEPQVRLEVDHILPVSKGGRDDDSNLRTLCQQCNAGKGARMDGETRRVKKRKR